MSKTRVKNPATEMESHLIATARGEESAFAQAWRLKEQAGEQQKIRGALNHVDMS